MAVVLHPYSRIDIELAGPELEAMMIDAEAICGVESGQGIINSRYLDPQTKNRMADLKDDLLERMN